MSIACDLILQNCQVASLREMSRVLCVGGRALIYVWAKDQKRKEMSSYLKQNKKNREGGGNLTESSSRERGEFGLPVHINRSKKCNNNNNNNLILLTFCLQDPVPAPRQPGALEAERRRGGRGKGISRAFTFKRS